VTPPITWPRHRHRLDAIESLQSAHTLTQRNDVLAGQSERLATGEAAAKTMESSADVLNAIADNYPGSHNLANLNNAHAEEYRRLATQLRAGLVDDGGKPLDAAAIKAEQELNDKTISGLHVSAENFSTSPAPLPSIATAVRAHKTPLGAYNFSLVQDDMGQQNLKTSIGAGEMGNAFLGAAARDRVKYLAKEKQGIDNMQADHAMWPKTFAATANALRTSESAQILLKNARRDWPRHPSGGR